MRKRPLLKNSAGVASALLFWVALCHGQTLPDGYLLPEETLSPDQRYGVLVPQADQFPDNAAPKNKLIEVKTGRVLAEIAGQTGWKGMNHQTVLPTRWSQDGTTLFWQVDGKWGPMTLVLIRIDDGLVKWQSDLYKEVVQAILSRTREAKPKEYAIVKNGRGYGSAYPDGFTIDIYAAGGGESDPLTFPLRIHADLTSDPKGITNDPLTSQLNGRVDQDGKFSVLDFQLGAASDLRQW